MHSYLADDLDLDLKRNPIKNDLYERCNDGRLLCKLINLSVPNTIDTRAISKPDKAAGNFQARENLDLALRSAEAIGCHVINIRPSDIAEGKKYLILSLLWQIIEVILFLFKLNLQLFRQTCLRTVL